MRDGDKLEAWAEPGLDIPGTCSNGLRGTQAEILGVFQTLCLRVQWPLKTVYNPYKQGRESVCKVFGRHAYAAPVSCSGSDHTQIYPQPQT